MPICAAIPVSAGPRGWTGKTIGGENTYEGDVGNDTNPQGGIDPDQRGRTNK